jgi:hypothetical protein
MKEPTALIQPDVVIHESARPLLADGVRAALSRLLLLLEKEAERHSIPVCETDISGFVDLEEGFEQVVVTQWVNASVESALDYWDRLGAAIEGWSDSLPQELAQIVDERIAVEVRWDGDDRVT